jgi:membrane protease YdiL (CAAX protease family)
MDRQLDIKRIGIYLAFAFGIAWFTGLVVYLTGGMANSRVLIPNTQITVAIALISTAYMGAPALAHVLTRVVTREGWQGAYLRPRLKRGWPYWAAAWLLPAVLTIAGGALFFVLYPATFDPSLSTIKNALSAKGVTLPFNIWLFIALQTVSGVLISPLVNGLFTFGEEFGWRAYLQPRLLPLGGRRTMLLMGVIWGVWHWPVILMGHNYGLSYPGAPYLGPLVMVWFTFVVGTFLGWAALRGGSVWPAVIGHAAVNGIANLGTAFVQGSPNPLLGPLPVGLIGSAGFALVALLILLSPRALRPYEAEAEGEESGEVIPDSAPR